MAVQLKGYNAVFDNEVYSQDFSEIEGKDIAFKRIIILTRYIMPTEDKVVSYIKQKANEVDATASLIIPGMNTSNLELSDLETMIIKLPQQIRMHIKFGEEKITEFIRMHTEALKLQEGQFPDRFLNVIYGILPLELIEVNQREGTIDNFEWYQIALVDKRIRSAGLGLKMQIKLALSSGSLPLKEDINVLLKHRTHESKTLQISRVNYDIKETIDLMDVLYSGFSSAEDITQLKDVSESVLEHMAEQPLMILHNGLGNAAMVAAITSSVAQKSNNIFRGHSDN